MYFHLWLNYCTPCAAALLIHSVEDICEIWLLCTTLDWLEESTFGLEDQWWFTSPNNVCLLKVCVRKLVVVYNHIMISLRRSSMSETMVSRAASRLQQPPNTAATADTVHVSMFTYIVEWIIIYSQFWYWSQCSEKLQHTVNQKAVTLTVSQTCVNRHSNVQRRKGPGERVCTGWDNPPRDHPMAIWAFLHSNTHSVTIAQRL